jgi:hypothetical protein
MEQRDRHAQVLSQAEKAVGSRARLANVLHVSADKIEAWLAGEELLPLEIFLSSLDLIADGPYAPMERPLRVAVIREP